MKQYKAWELLPEEKVYLKSEADKVIEEKDAEIARLKAIRKVHVEAIESMGAGLLQDEEKARHHKYKRCLAMADACRGNFLVAEHMIEKEPKNLMWHKRHKHYGRWMMLWRCFAEEFEEAKEALELVKKANALCKEA